MPRLTKAPIDFADTAPVRVTVDVDLNTSPADVWSLITDNPGWVNWFDGVTLCENTSAQTSGIGATRRIVVNGLQADEEFIAWKPERLWGFTVVETNRSFARRWVERIEITPANSGCHVRYSTGMELLPLAKLFRPILTRTIRNAWRGGLGNIDSYLGNS